MKVELFETGWLTAAAAMLQAGDASGGSIRFPVPVFLIETGDEKILVDTGLHPSLVTDPESHYDRPEIMRLWKIEQERSIAGQVDLDSLTMVIITHLHFDHSGGLPLVPGSVPIVIQRTEWEAAHDDEGVARNFFFPSDYRGRDAVLVDGDHDLLGDGSVKLLSTPGHTPGHQSVQVGDLVIGADVVHFASGLDTLVFPAFGHSHDQQAESAKRLRELRDSGLNVLPGHDADVLRPGRLI